MPYSVFVALYLACGVMAAVLMLAIYVCVLCHAIGNNTNSGPSREPGMRDGLSVSELEKLPKVVGKELVMGSECAVCLDEIGSEQAVRVMPGCKHGFHLECADAWLSKHSVCPLCRSKLHILLSAGSSESPC